MFGHLMNGSKDIVQDSFLRKYPRPDFAQSFPLRENECLFKNELCLVGVSPIVSKTALMLIEHEYSLMNSLFADKHTVPRGPTGLVFGDCPRMRTLPEPLLGILLTACLPNTFLRKHTMHWCFLEWICNDPIVPSLHSHAPTSNNGKDPA